MSEKDLVTLSQKALEVAVKKLGGSCRPGQVTMVEEVAKALQTDEHVLIQAGTGTGKSLGYLLPLLTNSAKSGQNAVVSTATLALQRQIVAKDAPLAAQAVENVTGYRPRIAVLKGWQNYLCLYKIDGGFAGLQGTLFAPDASTATPNVAGTLWGGRLDRGAAATSLAQQVKTAYQWAGETKTGDRDDFPNVISAPAWAQVSVSASECIAEHCPWRSQCFAMQARAEASEADLVVTNHAMLGIAAAGKDDLLPEAGAVVIDEAHDLVERVRSLSRVEISAPRVEMLSGALKKQGFDTGELSRLTGELADVLAKCAPGRLSNLPADLSAVVELLQSELSEALRQLPRKDQDLDKLAAAQVLRAGINDLSAALSTLDPQLVAGGSQVAWVGDGKRDSEGEYQREKARLYSAPLYVSDRLARRIWAERPVILTSATLALGGSFEPMAQANGFAFGDQSWRAIDVGTPFDLARQAILYVAKDLPAPRPGMLDTALLERAISLVKASGGGMLALFSSYRALQEAVDYFSPRLNYDLLVQGEDNLPTLVQAFRENESSCLLGTLSLWQGVDVPGPACRLVVIDKIPFPVPVDPLIEARSAAVEKRGGNPFMEVSLTHAGLLLAQGAGRLVRCATDRGVVAILDSRLATRRYGAYLRRTLPPMWYTEASDVVHGALRRLSATQTSKEREETGAEEGN